MLNRFTPFVGFPNGHFKDFIEGGGQYPHENDDFLVGKAFKMGKNDPILTFEIQENNLGYFTIHCSKNEHSNIDILAVSIFQISKRYHFQL